MANSAQVLAPPAVFHASGGQRLVAELAGPRNRVERPHQFAGQHVERADVARRRVVPFARSRPQHEQIAPHLPRRSGLCAAGRHGRAAEPLAQVHEAVGAEAGDRLARPRVELLQVAARCENDAAIGAVFVLPVVETAVGRRAFGIEPPDFLARHGIQRKHRAVFAQRRTSRCRRRAG